MKKVITLIAITIIACNGYAQNNFKPGWYIVEKGAEYAVVANGFLDYSEKGKAINTESLLIKTGEVVYVWENSKDTYIANEWFGRISFFKSISKLTPVPENGKIGYLLNDVENLNGKAATAGSGVWITEFITSNKTAVILLNDNQKITIPSEDITILATFLVKENENNLLYKTAK